MKKSCLLFLLLLAITASAQEVVDSKAKTIVIQSVNVIPMDWERILSDQTVIVKDNKIVQIGKKLKYPKESFVIDGRGKYLIPGLAEMHAHVPPVDDIEAMKDVLTLFYANGITTIRGMLGHPRHLELRERINKGEITGPRFYTTGPSFNGFSVKTAEDGERMVREQKTAGYDFLKLHPGLNKTTFPAIVKAAKEVGIPFVGHVSFGVGIWDAIDGGYSSIDHMDGFIEGLVPGIDKMVEQQTGPFAAFIADQANEKDIPKLMAGLKAHEIWVVPTQSLAERWFAPSYTGDDFLVDPNARYMSDQVVQQWIDSKKNLMANENYTSEKLDAFVTLRRKLIKACQDSGVGLLLGSDAPQVFNVPGFSAHQELQYLVQAGLTPYEALQTGTVHVADYLGLSDAGTIAPGKVADLVLLTGNPLINISTTQNIDGVMLNGKWMSRSFLDQQLEKAVKR